MQPKSATFWKHFQEPVKAPITLLKMIPLEGTRVAKVSSQFTAISEILKSKCLGKEEVTPPKKKLGHSGPRFNSTVDSFSVSPPPNQTPT